MLFSPMKIGACRNQIRNESFRIRILQIISDPDLQHCIRYIFVPPRTGSGHSKIGKSEEILKVFFVEKRESTVDNFVDNFYAHIIALEYIPGR